VKDEATVEPSAPEPKVTVEEREAGLADEVRSTRQYEKLRP